MANRTADLIANLPLTGTYPLDSTTFIPLATIQSNQVNHLRRFAETVERLEVMSKKELVQECFNTDEELFVRNLIQKVDFATGGSGGRPPRYDGWYPLLFYRTVQWRENDSFHETYGAAAFDALVADVHTDVPCEEDCGDPGSVLHEAIG